uniref:PPIase cyclophilin-type domain-containing protein n=1 Tax=Leersia perrieri TaxID=77586 RepID=A0A0D9V2A4_9ORYZ
MSSVYVLEPPTKGKVVVQTTAGPLDIELWPKEAPKAARNFVQLCLEGYYDGTLFHRIIKSFLVQGGDPTGSGTGGESIYGAPFADEFHTRLRFNHRGLVACANAGTPHSNGSQFFITLDRCDWLDKKNTIFGKVTGDSIFNLLALADIETDQDDRPVYPQKILSVEVLWNPFDDIVPRQIKKTEPTAKAGAEGKSKKKAVKQLNVLSFGDEVEEEENEASSSVKDKIKNKPHHKDKELPAHRSDDDNDDDDEDHRSTKSRKLSMKKKGIGSEASAERMSKGDANLQLLNPAEQEKHLQKQKRRRLQGREDETLAKLQKFKASFLSKNPATGNTEKKGVEEDYTGWHSNRLTFEPDSSKDGMTRKDDPDDYVVVDPLLEKGKQKFNKMQAKLKRREREWAGRSLT